MFECNLKQPALNVANFKDWHPDAVLGTVIGNVVGTGHADEQHMTGLELFEDSHKPSWKISSPIVQYPSSILEDSSNELVMIMATGYEGCYGKLSTMLDDIIIVFIVVGVVSLTSLIVPLFLGFGKKACFSFFHTLEDEIALLKHSKSMTKTCSMCSHPIHCCS